jgi:hypothetical protein
VTAEHEPAPEGEKQVLSDRLDSLETLAVELVGQPQDPASRMRGLDGDDLALELSKACRDAPETVTLGPGARVPPLDG